MSHVHPLALHDALQACLRAVLAWHEQALSQASLRARVGGEALWSQDSLVEAADSLGYDVVVGQIGPASADLPLLPAVCYTYEGTALAALGLAPDGRVLVVDPEQSQKPAPMAMADLLARLRGTTLSLVRRELPPVAGDAPTSEAQGRHGHWFWGPIVRMRWVYARWRSPRCW